MGVPEDVVAAIAQVESIKDTLLGSANTFLQDLLNASRTPAPYTTLTVSPLALPAIEVKVDEPHETDIVAEADSELGNIADTTSVTFTDYEVPGVTIPTFTANPPDITLPEISDPNIPDSPNKPTIGTVTAPEMPDYTMPGEIQISGGDNIPKPLDPVDFSDIEVPALPTSLRPVSLPGPLTVTIPTYNVTSPGDIPTAPQNTFHYSEEEYVSALLDAVNAKLLNDVANGGTGLGEAYTRAQWGLQEELNNKALRDAMDNVYAEFAGGCFDLPTGTLTANIRKLQSDFADKRMDVARTITIEELKLALQNTQWAVSQGIAVEQIQLAHHEAVAERALNVARSTSDIAVAVFNASVGLYNARLQEMQANAAAYEAQMRALTIQAEVWKSQLEGARLENEINMQQLEGTKIEHEIYRTQIDSRKAQADIQATDYQTQMEGAKLTVAIQGQQLELYKAQVDAITAVQNLYRIDMEGAKVELEVERQKIDNYRVEVEAYQAGISAEEAKLNAVKAKIEGEMTKVQVFDAQAKAFGSQVEAAKVQAEIADLGRRAVADNNKLLLDKYLAEVSVWKTKVETALSKVGMLVKAYEADISMYNAEIGKSEAQANINVKELELQLQNMREAMAASLETARINIGAAMNTTQVQVGAAHGGAQITATLLGAIFSSMQTLIHQYSGIVESAQA